MWTSYVGSASKAPRPEFTVMISIPFFEAFVSGSLSALASGTDVAITCAPAPIAALIPATCLATSLFAYTCVTVTPRDFRSFCAWSTPRLNTDQNEPVSPCVTTATLIVDAVAAANALLAGDPNAVRPAAASPPVTSKPRRLSCVSSSSRTSSSKSSSLIHPPFPLSLSTPGRLILNCWKAFALVLRLDPHRAPLLPRALCRQGNRERSAGIVQRAGAFAPRPNRLDEGAELVAIRT